MKAKKVQTPSEIQILIPQLKRTSEINFAVYNPRTITKQKLESLKRSILKFGFVVNLVVQKHGDILIAGHQRVRAMQEICKERDWTMPDKLPTVTLDVTEAEARLLNVALNNIEGEFDPFKLGELLASIRKELSAEDIIVSGFKADEFNDLIELVQPKIKFDPDPTIKGFAGSVTLSVEFATVEHRDEAKALLQKLTKGDAGKPGAFVLRALKACASGKRKISSVSA